MGLAQDVITSSPTIGEKIANVGLHGGSGAAVGSAATVILGMPVNEWVTMIVGVGGLIIAIMSYVLNAKYKRMHYELAKQETEKRLESIK